MRRFAAMAILTTSAFCLPTQPAQAEGDLVKECAQLVRSAVTRLNDALGNDVERCVHAIRRAKAAGETEKAHRIARHCIRRINSETRAAHEYVQEVCTRCVNALLDMGEVEAAERFRNFCADQLDSIERSGRRARHAIRDALNS